MDTSIEASRLTAPNHQADGFAGSESGQSESGQSGVGNANVGNANEPAKAWTAEENAVGRMSIDPMRATDRYRLVMPGDWIF